MKFGHFDDKNKEYVITNPMTPRSWTNYLGSTEFGSVITNHAGGYSFYKSAAQGRFLRLRFNSIPMDQPGRYIYLHDHDTKDYWSNSWQPVAKPLDVFKSTCTHGLGYTKIHSEYQQIETETTYFVPKDKTYECWIVRTKNNTDKVKNLSLFTYVEYANNWNAQDDMVNLQYTQYTLKMHAEGNFIDHGTNVNLPSMPDNFQEKDQGRHTFLAIQGADVHAYDTDREKFLGAYRTYANPIAVEQGICSNSQASGDNGCGTFQVKLALQPGEEKTFLVLMGVGTADEDGRKAAQEMSSTQKALEAFEELKAYWHERVSGMTVNTPDPAFNSMLNTWAPYNCLITYAWSRAASLVYSGERDGLGYRDSVQDAMGNMLLITDEIGERLQLMLSGQVANGGAMPVVKPYAHQPGKENAPKEEEFRSDDCLWLFNAVPLYVNETGNIDFYQKVIPYADHGEATVLGHLRSAIQFNLDRLGQHGLPCGLLADWNDCLELGQNGETVFVAFQLRFALQTYIEICQLLEETEEQKWAEEQLNTIDQNISEHAWDGEWFLRAYRHDGLKFGSHENMEGKIFMNPQVWSVISGFAKEKQADQVLHAVRTHLATDYGIMVCDPAFVETDYRVIRATLMNPGMKENAGIFNHTQGWGIIAEAMMGNGNQAYKYFKATSPASYNEQAEIREVEPYVVCQSTHSKYSPRFGASRVPWLSGAATWLYYAATNHILGIHPHIEGLLIAPAIPSTWDEFSVSRKFRGKTVNIHISNPNGLESGVKSIVVDGQKIEGNMIPFELLKEQSEVEVLMG